MNLSLNKLRAEFVKFGCQTENLYFYEETDSTNNRAREFAENSDIDAKTAVFIAKSQSAGRGRRGRRFISAGGTGLYMSILIPAPSITDTLTAYIAVKCAEAIESLTGAEVGIKWVNDLYLGEKKLAGILTEGIVSADTGKIKYAIIGIGINTFKTNFPIELKSIATDIESETGKKISQNTLAAMIFRSVTEDIYELGTKNLVEKYRSRSILKKEDVLTVHPTGSGEAYTASFVRIGDNAQLEVMDENGKSISLSSGEVSIRKV